RSASAQRTSSPNAIIGGCSDERTSSMPALPTGGNVRHFGALHLVSQPPPGLSHGKPKGLVSVGLRRACHHYTLLDQVFVNSDLHCTIPFVRTCRRYEQWSTAEVRSGNGGMRAKWTQRTPTKRRTAMHLMLGRCCSNSCLQE